MANAFLIRMLDRSIIDGEGLVMSVWILMCGEYGPVVGVYSSRQPAEEAWEKVVDGTGRCQGWIEEWALDALPAYRPISFLHPEDIRRKPAP